MRLYIPPFHEIVPRQLVRVKLSTIPFTAWLILQVQCPKPQMDRLSSSILEFLHICKIYCKLNITLKNFLIENEMIQIINLNPTIQSDYPYNNSFLYGKKSNKRIKSS